MIHERKIFDLSMIGTSDLGISEEHATFTPSVLVKKNIFLWDNSFCNSHLQLGWANKDRHPTVAEAIKRNFHLDIFAQCMAIVQLTEHICYSMRLILKMVRLSSSIWNCSSLVVTMNFSENDRSELGLIYFEAELHTSSLLFMQWKVYIDTRDV